MTEVVTRLEVGDIMLDLLRREVTRGGRVIHLQPREFALLEQLMRNAGRIVTRTMLLEQVWGFHFDPGTNVIDVHIGRLRRTIDGTGQLALIHTVRGTGYMLTAAHDALPVES